MPRKTWFLIWPSANIQGMLWSIIILTPADDRLFLFDNDTVYAMPRYVVKQYNILMNM